jgi:hypothetical protein
MTTISVQDLTVGEGNGFAEILVKLDAATTSQVSVKYTTTPWTAQSGAGYDFLATSGTLTFLPGETTKSVRIDLTDVDQRSTAYAEPIERFLFSLSNPTNATLTGEGYAWVTVIDNDTVVDNPEILVSDLMVDESAGSAQFVVTLGRLNGESARSAVSVDYSTANGSAIAGQDFTPATGRLTFLPGESTKTISVPLINDVDAEGNETFKLELSNPTTGVIARGSAIATIGANDAPAVSQPRIVVGDVTVSEGDVYANLVVQLTAPSSNRVAVNYTTTPWTAQSGAGYDFLATSGTLTFLPGETTKSVRVDLTDVDQRSTAYAEPIERFKLQLSNPSNATLKGDGFAWIQVVDNDTLKDNPGVYVGDALLNEDAGVARFDVTLGRAVGEGATGTVSVAFRTVDGTAKAGLDYQSVSGTLTFLPGESVKTVEVQLVNDALPESFESFQLVLSDALTGELMDAHGAALIAPSDQAASRTPTITALSAYTTESQGFVDVWVFMDAPSAQQVSVAYATQGGNASRNSDYTSEQGRLVFEPGQVARSIRIEVKSDTQIEGAETFNVTLSAPINATLGTNPTPAQVLLLDAQVGNAKVLALGLGDDQYVVTSPDDTVLEMPFGGFDTVYAFSDYTLPDQAEVLVLADTTATAGTGNGEANWFVGNRGNNRFDGLGGTDTLVLKGPQAAYSWSGNTAQRTISSGGEGTDTLLSIERLQFTDHVIVYDTNPGDRAYAVAALLQAAFNQFPDAALLSQWVAVDDAVARDFGDLPELAQEMINVYAPGVSDEALISHLWASVVGTPIPATELASFVGLLVNGTYTQATLAALAAEHPLNTVDLAGVAGTAWTLDGAWFPHIGA